MEVCVADGMQAVSKADLPGAQLRDQRAYEPYQGRGLGRDVCSRPFLYQFVLESEAYRKTRYNIPSSDADLLGPCAAWSPHVSQDPAS